MRLTRLGRRWYLHRLGDADDTAPDALIAANTAAAAPVGRNMVDVTTAEHREPRVEVLPPDEALRRARPLPRPEILALHDVSDEEWVAFHQALADR